MKLIFGTILISPFLIIGLIYLGNKHNEIILRHYNYYKLLLIKVENRLFHGYLIKVLNYVMRWSVPALYATLFVGLAYYFYKETYPKVLDPHPFVYNLLLGILGILFGLAVFTPPLSHSPTLRQPWRHDNLIFFPSECRTCNFSRPARSRHCRYCGNCVVLYDHHCIWLNNCVGMGNYQWFYSFLVANIVVMTYALYIVGCVLKRDWTGLNNIAEVKAEAALSFLLASFDCIVIWFTYMQYSLLRDGMTTNELSKWNIVHDLVQSGTLFELSGIYFEYLEHEDVFVSVNQTDNRVRNVTKDMLTQVGSIEQLTNIYDKGNLWDNVKERLDTKPLL